MIKENIIYDPYTSLEEQEAAEKKIKNQMDQMDEENKKLLDEIEECTRIEEEEVNNVKKKFKIYEIRA